MSSTGGGQHHGGIVINEGQSNEVYIDVGIRALRQMIQAIRYSKPDKYAEIATAIGDPVP